MSAVARLLRMLRPTDGWVAVSERLPKEGAQVIVYTRSGLVLQAARVPGGWIQVRRNGWTCLTGHENYVTHWRNDSFKAPRRLAGSEA